MKVILIVEKYTQIKILIRIGAVLKDDEELINLFIVVNIMKG